MHGGGKQNATAAACCDECGACVRASVVDVQWWCAPTGVLMMMVECRGFVWFEPLTLHLRRTVVSSGRAVVEETADTMQYPAKQTTIHFAECVSK
jgi:hypothetical protein